MIATQRTDRGPERFRLSVGAGGERPLLEPFGELGSAPALERELDALTAPGAHGRLDLSAPAFMDSTRLRTILAADERVMRCACWAWSGGRCRSFTR